MRLGDGGVQICEGLYEDVSKAPPNQNTCQQRGNVNNELRTSKKYLKIVKIQKSGTRPLIWTKSGSTSKFLYWSGPQTSTKKLVDRSKYFLRILGYNEIKVISNRVGGGQLWVKISMTSLMNAP